MRYSLDCPICPYVQDPANQEEALRVVEGEHWAATVRADQEYLGTTFITLRTHKEALEDLTLDEEHEFITIRNQLSTASKRAFGAAAVNLSRLMNNAFQDTLPSPHVHYHLKPRYETPVEFAGEIFTDCQFGQYITKKHPHKVSLAMGAAIALQLRHELPPA